MCWALNAGWKERSGPAVSLVISVAAGERLAVPTASAAKRGPYSCSWSARDRSGAYFIGDNFSRRKLLRRFRAPRWLAGLHARAIADRAGPRPHSLCRFHGCMVLTCKFNEAMYSKSGCAGCVPASRIVKLKADWTNGDPVITNMLQHCVLRWVVFGSLPLEQGCIVEV